MVRKVLNHFLKTENEIIDCSDAEALAVFGNNIKEKWLSRDFSHYKPRTKSELMIMMTKFCVSEDDWLTKKKGHSNDSGTYKVLSSNRNPRQNRWNKRCKNGSDPKDGKVNAGFENQHQGRSARKELF